MAIQCGPDYELNDLEFAAATLLYWGRNRKAGLEGALRTGFKAGPRGVKTKNGWFPRPEEGCDCESVVELIPSGRNAEGVELHRRDYWAWHVHCRSMAHIKYMVKFRWRWVYNELFKFNHKALREVITPALANKTLPFLINYSKESYSKDYKFIKEFVQDALAGNHFDMHKHMEDINV